MNYHNITYPDMNNGDGLRVVLWLSGCNHHCKNCQNPQTWDVNSGILFDESAKEELFRELDKDYISGLTLSGGDPLHEANLDGVLALVNKIRLSFPNKSIWIYSGYTLNQVMNPVVTSDFNPERDEVIHKRQEIVKQCTVMVDGRYIDSQRNPSKKWAGSDNQRVIDIRKSLEQNKVILYCD